MYIKISFHSFFWLIKSIFIWFRDCSEMYKNFNTREMIVSWLFPKFNKYLPTSHVYIEGWERKMSKCFFTYIHLELYRSHPSIYSQLLARDASLFYSSHLELEFVQMTSYLKICFGNKTYSRTFYEIIFIIV